MYTQILATKSWKTGSWSYGTSYDTNIYQGNDLKKLTPFGKLVVFAKTRLGAIKENKENKACENDYQTALDLDPLCVYALSHYGAYLAKQGNLSKAAEHLKKALSIEPNNILALEYYAVVLNAQGEIDEAITCCEKVLAIEPNNLIALWNYADALFKKDKFAEADIQCQKILKIDPKHADALKLQSAIATALLKKT